MKNILYTLLFTWLSTAAFAQNQLFFKTHFTEQKRSHAILATAVLASGETYLIGDESISKISTQGQLEWDKPLTASNTFFKSAVALENEGVFAIGSSTENGNFTLSLSKFNLNGERQWVKPLYTGSSDASKIIKQGNSFYVASSSTDLFNNITETVVLHVAESGAVLHQISFPGRFVDIVYMNSNVVLGISQGNSFHLKYLTNDLALIKATTVETFPSADFRVTALAPLPDDKLMAVGKFEHDMLLLKIDQSGHKTDLLTFDFRKGDIATHIAATTDGILITGYTNNPFDFSTVSATDIFLLKTDFNGNKIWLKAFGGINDDEAQSLATLPDGRIVLSGHVNSSQFIFPFVMQCSANGVIPDQHLQVTTQGLVNSSFGVTSLYQEGKYVIPYQHQQVEKFLIAGTYAEGNTFERIGWHVADAQGIPLTPFVNFSKPEATSLHSFKKIPQGGFIGLAASDAGFVGKTYYVFRLDDSGRELWHKEIDSGISNLESIIPLEEGGFLLSGNKDVAHTDYDIWLLKLDATGNTLWDKVLPTTKWDFIRDALATSDGYLLAGYKVNTYDGGQEALLTKVDKQGNIRWQKVYPMSSSDVVTRIIKTQENYVLGGHTFTADELEANMFLIKVDEAGNKLWSKSYGFHTLNKLSDLAASADGSLYMCGTVKARFGPLSSVALFAKVNATGDLQWQRFFGEDTRQASFHNFGTDSRGDLVLIGNLEEVYGRTKLIQYTYTPSQSGNQAPTAIALSALQVQKNSVVGTVVGTFSTIDPNPGDIHTYTLQAIPGSTDHTTFRIENNRLITQQDFTATSKEIFNIRVRSTDSQGGSITTDFTILVVPLLSNDPEISQNDFSIAGNNQKIYLTGDNSYTGSMTLLVYDMKGTQHMLYTLKKTTAHFEQVLELPQQLSSGLYVAQLLYGNRKLARKIVKL